MNFRISTVKRAIDTTRSEKDALASLGKIQFGLLLQIIQKEQPSADRVILPIGQISLH